MFAMQIKVLRAWRHPRRLEGKLKGDEQIFEEQINSKL
jgi:hypothetical protein